MILEQIFLFLILQLLITCLTWIRAKRFINLDQKLTKNFNKFSIKEIKYNLSLTRLFSYTFPFKIGDIVSFYYLKKKITNKYNSSISYILATKLYENSILFLIAILICIIFYFETNFNYNEKIYLRFLYIFISISFFLIIFKFRKKKI